jgi:cytoskeletal protein RodZ
MAAFRRASRYDFFKSIVAIILLMLFILVWRWTIPPLAAAHPTGTMPAARSPTPDANPVAAPASSTSVPRPSPTPSNEPAPTNSLSSPSATAMDASIATPLPSPTGTNPDAPTPSQSQTPLPTPTATLTIESTPSPTEETSATVTACEAAASRSHLQTGTNAKILRRLNFRSSSGIRDNWLRTNIPGTVVEVVGGPECLPHLAGAYIWWQVKLPNGEIGWSAEGSMHGTFYFMEPVQ